MTPSLLGGHARDTQYLFGVQEATVGNNVVVAFTIMSQSLNTEEEIFPLQFQVFKVCNLFDLFGDLLFRDTMYIWS